MKDIRKEFQKKKLDLSSVQGDIIANNGAVISLGVMNNQAHRITIGGQCLLKTEKNIKLNWKFLLKTN